MRYILFFITLAIFQPLISAGQIQIKVQQYRIIIDRTVTRNDVGCRKYDYISGGTHTSSNCMATSKDDKSVSNYCLVDDPNCNTLSSSEQDNIDLIFHINSQTTNYGLSNKIISSIPRNTTQTFTDTIELFQPEFGVTSVTSELNYYDVSSPTSSYYDWDHFSKVPIINTYSSDFYIDGSFFDKQFSAASFRYTITTRVRVIPNLDPTFTLPSHDRITMTAANATSSSALEWQYSPDGLTWNTVPSGHTSGSYNELLNICGTDLFPTTYKNHLNSTIFFKVKYNSGSYSDIVPFTLRLSSPHITGVSAVNLDCYERNEGSIKLKFDRELFDNEKLNILIFDTLHYINYSALNLDATNMDSDTSYTFPNTLGAGMYYVNLLGKYATGIPYDLYENVRNTDTSTYTALNSVNFQDGFESATTDDFWAFTDYTAFSQATYTGALTHFAFQEITQPQQINFALKVDSNVLCKGSSTGVLTLMAEGGQTHYRYSIKNEADTAYSPWVDFDNDTVTTTYIPDVDYYPFGVMTKLRNLPAGKYYIRVRDNVDCYNRDATGAEKVDTFEITEPDKALTVDLFDVSPITNVDSTNGAIRIQVSGGTPFPTANEETIGYPYKIEWRDSATNQLISPTLYNIDTTGGEFETYLKNLQAGTYIVKIYDKSYNPDDTANAGCYIELVIPMKKPDPLVTQIIAVSQISCHDSTDAVLLARAYGGLPLDDVRYTFKWYSVNAEGTVLLSNTDSIFTNVQPGKYMVEVKDKYNNTVQSQVFELVEPQPMHLSFTTTQASCYSSFDGSMAVAVSGGTPFSNTVKPYIYEWSNGALTASVNNVAGGAYVVVVRDSMGCITTDTVSVTSPVRVIATPDVHQVSCSSSTDGSISLSVAGGSPAYTYQWSTGETTPSITGLAPGTYWYQASDSKGCFDTDTITLDKPDTMILDLGTDRNRNMCIGQTLRINAASAANNPGMPIYYSWTGTDGFTADTSKVYINTVGTYIVTATNNRGCVLKDTMQVTFVNSTINTDFLVSTQAYVNDDVYFVNISRPTPDSVQWTVPTIGNSIRVLSQNNDGLELAFSDTGRYPINMRAYYASGCIDDTTKTVNVISRTTTSGGGSQDDAFLQLYAVIVPNPNTGTFTVNLTFSQVTTARLRLINILTNLTVDDRQIRGDKDYSLSYDVGASVASGIYMLVIDTPKGGFVYKVVIAK